jgi:hypothetical protein
LYGRLPPSGALPPGVKVAYDAAARALRLTGVPGKAGTFSASFQLSEQQGSKTVKGGTVAVTVTVAELVVVHPAAAAVFTADGAVIDPNTARVTGTVRFSASKTGKLTAKYRGVDGTKSFSGSAWSGHLADGTVFAVLATGKTHTLAVSLGTDGQFTGTLTPAGKSEQTVDLSVIPWTKASPAGAYAGSYTVSLSSGLPPVVPACACEPMGYSFLTLSMKTAAAAKSGTVRYAGTLADGTAVSGSALLAPVNGESGEQGYLTVFVKKTGVTLGARLVIDADAAETYRDWPSSVSACGGVEPYWTRVSGYAETSFDIALDICGGYYNSSDSLVDCWNAYEGRVGPFQLMAPLAYIESVYGTADDLPLVDLAVTERTLKIAQGALNPTRARLTLARTTGIIRGSFRIPFTDEGGKVKNVTATYAGVLLPGWTGDCGCSLNGAELPEKPFAMGAFWYADKASVLVAGESKTVAVKQSYPVIIQKAAE